MLAEALAAVDTFFPPPPTSDSPATLALTPSGRQWLDVSGHVVDRFLVTYRAPARELGRLVPAPFVLDEHRGHGFVSVCALEVTDMGIRGAPRWLRWQNRELLYRIGVRLGAEATFLTLRSDVSARALALLGRFFSHHRPHAATVELARDGGRFRFACRSGDGAGDAALVVDGRAPTDGAPATSLFADAAAAARFLVGMRCSADLAPDGRARVQRIDHDPWDARFVAVEHARFAFLERFEREHGIALEYDGTLAMHGIDQIWRAARCR
jgi:hypothetical protein